MRPVGNARILLVEDNPGDVRLIQEVLRGSTLPVELHTVVDGVEAMAYLRHEGKYAREPRPSIILLDLNLPRKDGRQVLLEVKADPQLRTIPVVVLTSSEYDEDVLRAYDLMANCYVRKPLDFEQFGRVVHAIERFWFTIVELPPAAREAAR